MSSQISQDLQTLLDRIGEENSLTLGDLLHETSERSFSLIISLVVLPFLAPTPPGFTTLPSLAALLLSLQIALGRKSPWLPASTRRVQFPPAIVKALLSALKSVTKVLDRLTRPRLPGLVQSPPLWRINGLCLAWLSFLLLTPLPLTNSLFTFNILLLTTAMLEGDGLLMCVAYGLMAVCTFALIGGAYILWQTPELLQQFL